LSAGTTCTSPFFGIFRSFPWIPFVFHGAELRNRQRGSGARRKTLLVMLAMVPLVGVLALLAVLLALAVIAVLVMFAVLVVLAVVALLAVIAMLVVLAVLTIRAVLLDVRRVSCSSGSRGAFGRAPLTFSGTVRRTDYRKSNQMTNLRCTLTTT
jgi:hypothetical protein